MTDLTGYNSFAYAARSTVMNTQSETILGYKVRQECWTIVDRHFDLVWPADMDALLDAPLTQKRSKEDDYMPYWAQPWPGAVLLAEAVLNGEAGLDRPAIELGCGIGISSLAAAAKGWSINATDYDADALRFAQLNAERNNLTLAGCELLDYRIPLASPRFDLILGADLTYERKKCEPVARWLASALKPGGIALISDPNRSAADEFPDYAQSFALNVQVTAVETSAPAGLLTRGRIWRLTRSDTLRGK
jgi:predicted nicotinamide N-methyase